MSESSHNLAFFGLKLIKMAKTWLYTGYVLTKKPMNEKEKVILTLLSKLSQP